MRTYKLVRFAGEFRFECLQCRTQYDLRDTVVRRGIERADPIAKDGYEVLRAAIDTEWSSYRIASRTVRSSTSVERTSAAL